MKEVGDLMSSVSNFIWDWPLVVLLMGGGIFFLIYSKFLPFRYLGHAINVLRGKFDHKNDPGDINHFQALSGALAATVGMGNISGVALAIVAGGPGVLFWMWVSAFVGMATKYFTCTLAVMYRGIDSNGDIQGGPMYVITEGLGKNWKPLAIFFCLAGFFGATPVFQANQIVDVVGAIVLEPIGISLDSNWTRLYIGIGIAIPAALVILGGIKRIGSVASRLVPSMVLLYAGCVLLILLINYEKILPSFGMIFEQAFTLKGAGWGIFLALMIEGAKRAAFSNEAGVGTAPLMHGAAKTNEPVREGLVAMLGPAIDTLIVCTMTGLAILVTGLWQSDSSSAIDAILLTAAAFGQGLGTFGTVALTLCVLVFAFTTIFGFAYYGRKCLSFLIGAKYGAIFDYWYVAIILIGSVASLDVVVSVIFIAYGLMTIPTMISSILLAPKVMEASKRYFEGINK
ncbi:MAG: sodium:alanine symporter family protein [Cytophagales bacterium]|nr:sodium:alanine symporter family protein [Cytophagales bacterium]